MKSARVIVPCVVSYLHCFEPYSFNKTVPGKYMATLIVPKQDLKTCNALHSALEVAIERGKNELWGGKKPTNLFLPIHDGDEKEKEADIYKNSLYITAKSKTPPQVVNQRLQPIYKKEDIFSGCFCNVSITFVPFSTGAIKGVTTRLGNIQLVRKGVPIGGRTKAEDEFQVIEIPESTTYVEQQEQQVDKYIETAGIEMNDTNENFVSEVTDTNVPQTELPYF